MNAVTSTRSRRNRFNPLYYLVQSVSILAALAVWLPACAFTINPIFDSSITGDPQAAAIEAEINSAIAVYENTFSDPVTVAITFQKMSDGLGQSQSLRRSVSYSDYRAAMVSHTTTADDATALVALPNGANNPVNGSTSMYLNLALARALGFSADPPSGQSDGVIGLKTSIMNLTRTNIDPNKYSLFAVVSHEIDEVLGFGSALNGLTNEAATPTGAVYPEDLFRFAQNGARSFTTALNATAYFSLEGTTDLAQFNQDQEGDFGDWYSPGGQTPQVQDAFGTAGANPVLGVELRVLDAIGFHRGPDPVWVDFNWLIPQFGTFQAPYRTLAQGVAAVPSGGTIVIKPGNSSETVTSLNKPMTIVSAGGAATIGRP